MNLLESLGLKKTIGLFGVEIEVEGRSIPRFDSIYWKIEADNSLRGESAEYVLKRPMALESVIKGVEEINKQAKEWGTVWNFSFRTSTHVHMNVQSYTHEELLTLIYTYYLLENPMINFCGEERKCNRFCLRLEDAEAATGYIRAMFEGTEKTIAAIPKDMLRYSSLNLEAIMKYGSVEFRGMRGTVDAKEIRTWLSLILAIRDYAQSKKTPIDVYNDFIKLGSERFARVVFGEFFKEIKYPNLVNDINRSFSLTIDFPFGFRDKNAKKKEEEKKVEYNEIEIGGAPRDVQFVIRRDDMLEALPRDIQLERAKIHWEAFGQPGGFIQPYKAPVKRARKLPQDPQPLE